MAKKLSMVLMVSFTMVSFLCMTNAQADDGGYRIFKLDKPGSHPAVIFFPGCSGFKRDFAPKFYEHKAAQLRELGFVVVWADYLGRRNLEICSDGFGFSVTQQEASRDVIAAASWLRSQPYVDTNRITAMGWSYGGGCVLTALSSHKADELIFTKAIVYYPLCAGLSPWSHRIPVLVLQAGADNVAPHRMCDYAFDKSQEKGNLKIIYYPGAHHCFDMSELPPKMEYIFGTIGYHQKAAAEAWKEVKRFLQATR
jgi:dienelactone hydrolase